MELKQWFACLKKGNTPHGVLLAGPEGSGKKDYARQAAALYLKGTAEPEALTDCPYSGKWRIPPSRLCGIAAPS